VTLPGVSSRPRPGEAASLVLLLVAFSCPFHLLSQRLSWVALCIGCGNGMVVNEGWRYSEQDSLAAGFGETVFYIVVMVPPTAPPLIIVRVLNFSSKRPGFELRTDDVMSFTDNIIISVPVRLRESPWPPTAA
jgi:hypothetical protein